MFASAFAASLVAVDARAVEPLPIDRIRLPEGFSISVYAADVPNARSMALGEDGTLYVGTRAGDDVYAITDRDCDGKPDAVLTIASGLRMPNGVAIRDSALFVAEVSRVLRFDDIAAQVRALEATPSRAPRFTVVNDRFPSDAHHGWKFIRFSPGGDLFVPVGAPCNVCEEKDPRYASIMRMKPSGEGLEVFASGIRNTVGFDWHPVTGELWFTDNGRDWLGDEWPPDELNSAPRKGMHFGFPYCHGRGLPDPDFGGKAKCAEYTPAAQELGPHVAALGMRFYTGTQFPEEYRNQIFIAEHGSWNRSTKIGYRVALVRLEENKPASYEVFADGWLHEGDVWGRPVDVLVMPDGSLLVSDDYAGAI